MKLWVRAVPSASPVRHNGCHRFPKSNRQISTNPISSAFSGRYFSLAACAIRFPKSNRQIPTSPIFSVLVAIFPPPPCAIRFPKSNRQTPTSPISSAFSGRYFFLILHHACCVSRCVSPLDASPGRRLQLLTVQTVLSSEALGASSSKRLPGETWVPLDFPSQIVKSPTPTSPIVICFHLLCSGRYSAFSHFTSFSCCVSRCVSPLCLPGAAFATAHRPAPF